MSALRQRASCIARRSRPTNLRISRAYASGSHGKDDHGHDHSHHSSAQADESLGTTFYLTVGAIPAAVLVYTFSRPGKDGESSSITKFLDGFSNLGQRWEERNTLHTAAIEQAAHDRHLFLNSGRNTHVELKFPEIFQTGSPRNVPAGHSISLDHVVEHYRQQHLDEEERKARKTAAERQEGQ